MSPRSSFDLFRASLNKVELNTVVKLGDIITQKIMFYQMVILQLLKNVEES